MYCSPRDLIQATILHFRIWEPSISRAIRDILQPGDVFIDIGSNVGYDALLGATCVGKSGKVIAIEAAPDTYRLLKRNIDLNGFENIVAVEVAVSDVRGSSAIYSGPKTNSGAATILREKGAVELSNVATLPLDEIVDERDCSRVSLIKMDIEGAEIPVLARIVETLHLYPQDIRIIAEISFTGSGKERVVFESLRAQGFAAYKLENGYGYQWYLMADLGQSNPPTLLENLPEETVDVLFTRIPVAPT